MKKIALILLLAIVASTFLYFLKAAQKEDTFDKMTNLVGMTLNEAKEYATNNKLVLKVYEIKSDKDGIVLEQSINEGAKIANNYTIYITVGSSKDYVTDKIDESGNIPVMMYHHIVDMKDSDTEFTGGNVDASGYSRTTESFKRDLEKFYNEGYRMIPLVDYINGIIDVEYGKSPIVLTFDDGNADNIKVTGLDSGGNIIIDPNSAVGILESFKSKYPDYNVTATFFLHNALFNQPKYNEKILKWLIDNGYDIGNHSYGHANLTDLSNDETSQQIAKQYNNLEKYINNKYVNIVALPFGSPFDRDASNYNYILNSSFEGKEYKTESTLRVGWEADYSPFHINFDKTYIKRVRAYDNNGKEFDITSVFESLNKYKYISDGKVNVITVPSSKIERIKKTLGFEINPY